MRITEGVSDWILTVAVTAVCIAGLIWILSWVPSPAG